jgi:hypothetical protein
MTVEERFASYRSTSFYVDLGQAWLCFRIGERNAALDRLVGALDSREWAFLTAGHPAGRCRAALEEQRAELALLGWVRGRGYPYCHGAGVDDLGCLPPEPCLLVLQIPEPEALALGRRFGQEAIVVGRVGEVPILLSCRPPRSPRCRAARLGH